MPANSSAWKQKVRLLCLLPGPASCSGIWALERFLWTCWCLPAAKPGALVWMLTWPRLRKRSSSTARVLPNRYALPVPCGCNSLFSMAEEAVEVVRKASQGCIYNREFAKWRAISLFSHSMVLKPRLILKLVQYSQLLCSKLIGRTMIWPHAALRCSGITGTESFPTINSKAESLPDTPNKWMVTSSAALSCPNSYRQWLVSMVSCRQVWTRSASTPSSWHVCLVTCSWHSCSAVSGLSKPCGQGVLPCAEHCSAREAMHGAAAQLWSWIYQIQDCQNWPGIFNPLSSWEQKNLWQGMKCLHPTSHAKPHVWCWQ